MRKANFTKSLFIQRTFFLSMCLLRDHRFHSRHPHERKMAVITVQGRYMYMSDGYSSPLTSSVYHAQTGFAAKQQKKWRGLQYRLI